MAPNAASGDDDDDFTAFTIVVDASACGGLDRDGLRCVAYPSSARVGSADGDVAARAAAANRVEFDDIERERAIDAAWAARVRENGLLFNATKFRFASARNAEEDIATTTPSNARVVVELGITDYKTFLCTNLAADWRAHVRDDGLGAPATVTVGAPTSPSSSRLMDLRYRHFADALGNCVMLHTTDDKFMMLQRSESVGEAPGAVVFPGGHAEPSAVNVADAVIDVSHLMFTAAMDELEEELGVGQEHIKRVVCLGITRRVVNARSCMIFYAECRLTADEALALYPSAEHGFESHRAFSAILSDFENPEFMSRVPGDHCGAAELLIKFLSAR